jgi:streptogramin lyase
VWVANPRARTVTRVDARSGKAQRFALDTSPTDIAVGAGAVWTVDQSSGRMLRFDPSSRAVRELEDVGVPVAIEMTASGPWVLSLDDGSLYGFNGNGDRTTYDLAVPVLGAGALAVLGDDLWILGYEDKFLVPVNHELRRIVRDATRLGVSSVASMTAGGGFLWLADTVDRRLMRFEPRSRTPRNTVLPRSVRPVAMAVGGCGWTIDASGRVARFDPATGRFAGEPVRMASAGGEIVADDGGAWLTDPRAGELLHIRTRSR